ncbi:hypothetical protein BV20DRAFT_1052034 [Pilatotrama ljubarskyi]|nr:hypothetical protein BV20DRAFT_1052034 [Pilatotrama ljubarskyi]
MDAFFTIAPPVPVESPVDIPVDNDDYGTGGNHGSCTIAYLRILVSAMDAFFTIAPAIPDASVEDKPIEDILVEGDRTGTSGNHGSCVIA